MKKMWKKCRLKRKIHSNPEMDYCENNSGITLIALVVTILVMLILVGVTLSQIVANNGIISQTETASIEQKTAQAKEIIELIENAVEMEIREDTSKASKKMEIFIEKLQESGFLENIEIQEDGSYFITIDGCVFEVLENDGEIEKDYVGEPENIFPSIRTISLTSTTNSINIQVEAKRMEGGTYKYYYKRNGDSQFNFAGTSQESTYTIEGLTQCTKYIIKVEVIDSKNASNQKESSISTLQVEAATDKVTFGNVVWIDGKATLDTTTLLENYQIQYQVDGIEEGGWTVGTTVSGVSHGSVVYVRLFDGINFGKEASFTVTDTQAPTTATISSSNIGSTSFTLNATGADAQSGVAKYEFYVDGSLYDTVVTKETTATCNVTGKTTGTTYNCYVIVKDEADLPKQSASINVLCNVAPVVSTVSTGTRTTSSIQVSAKATDADGDNLIYKLYVGGTLKATSASTAQNTTVSLTATNLSNYTSYNYYVTVTDGIETVTSSNYSAKTKCPGNTKYCSGGGTSSYYCDGTGYYCDGGGWLYPCCVSSCTYCGHSLHSGSCRVTSSGSRFNCGCGHNSSSCRKSSERYSCSHGYTSSHQYCSHGNTSGHYYGSYSYNCSHGYYSSHYYCSHGNTSTHD